MLGAGADATPAARSTCSRNVDALRIAELCAPAPLGLHHPPPERNASHNPVRGLIAPRHPEEGPSLGCKRGSIDAAHAVSGWRGVNRHTTPWEIRKRASARSSSRLMGFPHLSVEQRTQPKSAFMLDHIPNAPADCRLGEVRRATSGVDYESTSSAADLAGSAGSTDSDGSAGSGGSRRSPAIDRASRSPARRGIGSAMGSTLMTRFTAPEDRTSRARAPVRHHAVPEASTAR